MRVFLVSNMFPSSRDQLFGVFVRNFKNEMEKQGVVFSRSAIIRGKSYSKFKKLGVYLKHYWRIFLYFFTNDYDLIYVHFLTHHIPVLIPLLPLLRKPIVINVHGSDINLLLHNSFMRFWGKIILKRIDLLVVPTKKFQEIVLQTFPFMSKEKIVVSPSGGIDENLFYPIPKNKTEQEFTIGFISRFVEEKGWLIFLEALEKLKVAQVPFRAIMGGKGPDEPLIRSKISEMGLEPNIDFRGFIHQKDLSKVYNELSVYVFPTFRDSLGLTGLEAMSCGIPVIASQIEGGPSTYVEHGKNGYLFSPGNSNALYETIIRYEELEDGKKGSMETHALRTAKNYKRSAVAKNLKERLLLLAQ